MAHARPTGVRVPCPRHLAHASQLIVVTNRALCSRPFLEQVERVCELRPRALVLREKDLDANAYRALAEDVLALCHAQGVPCILHSHAALMPELGADGVHLPLPLLREAPRGQLEACGHVGCSVHSAAEAFEAQELGATCLFAGHVYATDCKSGLPARGLGFLREACSAVQVPVYAIGGMRLGDGAQLREVMECGAAGACVMSAAMRL